MCNPAKVRQHEDQTKHQNINEIFKQQVVNSFNLASPESKVPRCRALLQINTSDGNHRKGVHFFHISKDLGRCKQLRDEEQTKVLSYQKKGLMPTRLCQEHCSATFVK